MCLAWIILEILIIFFYKNLNEFDTTNTNNIDETSPLAINNNEAIRSYDSIRVENSNSVESITNEDEQSKLINSQKSESYKKIRIVDNSETGPLLVRLYNEYVREEIVAVMATTFSVFLMQTSLEVFKLMIRRS